LRETFADFAEILAKHSDLSITADHSSGVSLASIGGGTYTLAHYDPQPDQDTMDANELRALQAPLKKQYREQPETALTSARAEALLDLDRVACRMRSWGGETTAGLHPATGGDGSLACSADMLLEALVACAGVTMSAVATAMGVKLRGGRVTAEGHWDARGTVGVDREVAVGLTDIALMFELDTEADTATVQRLVETTERFCVIYQTLRMPPRLSVTHQIVDGARYQVSRSIAVEG
jgi:uncharacterized OsmC-like protein